jgi:hypothetical protein
MESSTTTSTEVIGFKDNKIQTTICQLSNAREQPNVPNLRGIQKKRKKNNKKREEDFLF